MPSFVSRLEEAIFAAAWVRADALFSIREELGRATAMAYAERVVQQFREAEREAAKRALPAQPVKFAPYAPVAAEPSWMEDETRMIEKVPSE